MQNSKVILTPSLQLFMFPTLTPSPQSKDTQLETVQEHMCKSYDNISVCIWMRREPYNHHCVGIIWDGRWVLAGCTVGFINDILIWELELWCWHTTDEIRNAGQCSLNKSRFGRWRAGSNDGRASCWQCMLASYLSWLCTNSNLASQVDTENYLGKIAFYAIQQNAVKHSPLGK